MDSDEKHPIEDERVPCFDAQGGYRGVCDRRLVMEPGVSKVYGQSGNVIFAREGLFAFAVRAPSKATWPGALDFTAGGMSAPGELEFETALRETEEELFIRLPAERISQIAWWIPADGFGSRGSVFLTEWGSDSSLPFNVCDIESIRWMSADAARALARNPDTPMKPDLRAFLLSGFWPPRR